MQCLTQSWGVAGYALIHIMQSCMLSLCTLGTERSKMAASRRLLKVEFTPHSLKFTFKKSFQAKAHQMKRLSSKGCTVCLIVVVYVDSAMVSSRESARAHSQAKHF